MSLLRRVMNTCFQVWILHGILHLKAIPCACCFWRHLYSDQLFFISFARAWAQNIKPQTAVQRIRADPHSPNLYRVIGTLVNTPEFASTFNCSIGSKVWRNLFIGPDSDTLSSSTRLKKNDAGFGNPNRRDESVVFVYTYTYYRTPFVLGTSPPPVLSIACRMARASALNADSALWVCQCYAKEHQAIEPTGGDHFHHVKRLRAVSLLQP